MKRQTKNFLVFFLFLLALTFSGCQSNSSQISYKTPKASLLKSLGDGGFLSKEPCGPPCFLNIIPGLTDVEQAKKILTNYFDAEDCIEKSAEGKVRGVRCHYIPNKDSYVLSIDFDDTSMVDSVGFSPSIAITVQELIIKYGKPDGVDVISWTEEGELPRKVFMALYYSRIKTRVILPLQESETYQISPSTQVEGITYVNSVWWSPDNLILWQEYGEYPVSVP